MKVKVSLFILFVIVGIGCSKEEFEPRDYPHVITENALMESNGVVTLQGSIHNNAGHEIVERGFIVHLDWTSTGLISKSAQKIYLCAQQEESDGVFTAKISAGLRAGYTIRYRSCVVSTGQNTETNTVYGEENYFVAKKQPAPTFTSFSNRTASPAGTLLINGTNFSEIKSANTVTIGGYYAKILESTSTSLLVQIPYFEIQKTHPVVVNVGGNTIVSSMDFTILQLYLPSKHPYISRFLPSSAKAGDEIIIQGANFSNTIANQKVYFNHTEATILDITPSAIKVKVPNLPYSNATSAVVWVIREDVSSAPVAFKYVR